MNLNLENGWQILPIGGDTDTAYMGIKSDQKVFLKRNTSPFLAALSLEEIAPRLIWTKRISTGDTLTAQEWLNGRSLYRSEMGQKSVSDLLYKVHHTPVLKKMLIQVGGKVVTPIDLVRKYFEGLPDDLNQHPLLNKVANYLKANQPDLKSDFYEVCHGDLNHKNWLLSDKEKLYLVDWESARIADPASDLSMLIQVGGKVVTPIDLVRKYFEGLPDDLNQHPLLNKVANYLKANQPDLKSDFYEVCHGDLNHKNWLLSDKEKLYLVDWESARIADPASDLSMLMCQYVPRKNWEQWLRQYGLEVNRDLWYRIYWYSLINLLLDVKYYHQRGRFTEMNQDILKISELINELNF